MPRKTTSARPAKQAVAVQNSSDPGDRRVAAADRMWESHDGELPSRNVGGMPHPVDVGTAGDQILAVQLNSSLCRLIDIIASMADHPSVVSWQRRHPDDGASQLLLTNPYPLERIPRR